MVLDVIAGSELLFCEGSEGTRFPIADGQALIVGRGNGADIRLSGAAADPQLGCIVARRHVEIERHAEQIRCRDCGAAAGARFAGRVQVNGQPLQDSANWQPLLPGDVVTVGDVSLRLNVRDDH